MIHRRAVRALIITGEREVLLMRIRSPHGGDCFWIAPGGGVEGDETAEATLQRELAEELGLIDFEPGPAIWRRHHTFNWGGRRISQKEEYRIVHADRFTPVMADEAEARVLDCFRWWSIADLPGASERLTPLSLADILERYLRDGAPSELPDEEVLID
ncbi:MULTISPECIES: NUDIX domain-containing protein [Bradyrhizobium]|uniref:NUDIX domain-containing protein n=1 Tax=Bradyrhizobium TaxID=374 RepID=UPI00145731A3|nr:MULTISPECIES: NUDIX domain-containing protein [Bradyrhizobium]MCP1847549.1 8-oxo-dGTP pyrophosphatase MutT (NUDIX family) [Bradyrhizobium sp. USDA 4541]NLS69285.1 NUDIX domain-containing protein [Bradyrhizobium brasilense]